LWQALATLRNTNAIPRLRLRLIGTVDPAVWRSIEEYDLTPIVENEGFVSHEEALRRMARSTLLLLVIEAFEHADGMITSKLYEYLASERPVLGVGPPAGDAAALLQRHSAGTVATWGDATRIQRAVRDHYEAWAEGKPKTGADRKNLATHTRRHQGRRMARVLDEVTGRTGSSPHGAGGEPHAELQ